MRVLHVAGPSDRLRLLRQHRHDRTDPTHRYMVLLAGRDGTTVLHAGPRYRTAWQTFAMHADLAGWPIVTVARARQEAA